MPFWDKRSKVNTSSHDFVRPIPSTSLL